MAVRTRLRSTLSAPPLVALAMLLCGCASTPVQPVTDQPRAAEVGCFEAGWRRLPPPRDTVGCKVAHWLLSPATPPDSAPAVYAPWPKPFGPGPRPGQIR